MGILRYGSYVPYFRVKREAMGAGKGERAVAGYDEDSASMAVEAARDAIRGVAGIDTLLFATTSPPYAEKLNAATIQGALGLPESIRSVDVTGSARVGLTSLLLAADLAAAGKRTLVCTADVTIGAPGGPRESQSGDGATAFVFGPDEEAAARVLGHASSTSAVLDVWRSPEQRFAKQWEERFGAEALSPVAVDTTIRALRSARVEPGQLTSVILDSGNPRIGAAIAKTLKSQPQQLSDVLADRVGRAGAAHSGLVLARVLDQAKPGDRVLVVSVADGCDAVVLEVTPAIAERRATRSVDRWIESKGNGLAYNNWLKWRGILPFEPPRRPDPERPAAPPMRRHEHWKLAFFGSRCAKCGTGQLPPQRVCVSCGAVDQMKEESFADRSCRIATYTIDHLAYSLQPPVVLGVVDYEGGGRFTTELTDVAPADVAIGNELEMTFRRLYSADGVHNYFWKARPRR